MDTILQHPFQRKRKNSNKILGWAADPITTHRIDSRFRRAFHDLATAFVQRRELCGLVGQSLDQETLAYWIGAAVMARSLGQADLAEAIAKYGAQNISARGYAAIVELTMS